MGFWQVVGAVAIAWGMLLALVLLILSLVLMIGRRE